MVIAFCVFVNSLIEYLPLIVPYVVQWGEKHMLDKEQQGAWCWQNSNHAHMSKQALRESNWVYILESQYPTGQ